MGEDFVPGICHKNRVFPLRRQLVVLGHDGPLVRQEFYRRLSGIDHGFNGEGHAGFQLGSRTFFAIVQNLWFVVEDLTDTVPAIFFNDGKSLLLREPLDDVTDVTQMSAGFHGLNTEVHSLLTGFGQPVCHHVGFADDEGLARVAVVLVFNQRHVDVHDIAVLQDFVVTRDTVAHDMVHRRTDGFWEASVVQRGGNRVLLVHGVVVTDPVQLSGGDSGLYIFLDHFELFGGKRPHSAHFLNGVRVFNFDGHAMVAGYFEQRTIADLVLYIMFLPDLALSRAVFQILPKLGRARASQSHCSNSREALSGGASQLACIAYPVSAPLKYIPVTLTFGLSMPSSLPRRDIRSPQQESRESPEQGECEAQTPSI